MKPELRSVVAEFAGVRAEQDDAAAQVTQVLAGEPLHVEEWRDGWWARSHRLRLPGLGPG